MHNKLNANIGCRRTKQKKYIIKVKRKINAAHKNIWMHPAKIARKTEQKNQQKFLHEFEYDSVSSASACLFIACYFRSFAVCSFFLLFRCVPHFIVVLFSCCRRLHLAKTHRVHVMMRNIEYLQFDDNKIINLHNINYICICARPAHDNINHKKNVFGASERAEIAHTKKSLDVIFKCEITKQEFRRSKHRTKMKKKNCRSLLQACIWRHNRRKTWHADKCSRIVNFMLYDAFFRIRDRRSSLQSTSSSAIANCSRVHRLRGSPARYTTIKSKKNNKWV